MGVDAKLKTFLIPRIEDFQAGKRTEEQGDLPMRDIAETLVDLSADFDRTHTRSPKMQKVVMITASAGTEDDEVGALASEPNLDELNELLASGWRVISVTPMGVATGSREEVHAASLVVIEK